MNKKKLMAIVGIPFALIGLAAAGVAFAAPKAPVTPVTVPVQERVTAPSHAVDTDTETNDDTSGPQEAPGVEQAD